MITFCSVLEYLLDAGMFLKDSLSLGDRAVFAALAENCALSLLLVCDDISLMHERRTALTASDEYICVL